MAAYTDSLIPKRATSDYWFSNIRPGVAALFLGGAFGAGVYLGNAEPSADDALEMAGSEAWLAQVDARSDKLDGVRSELELRYHAELVGPPRDSRDRRRRHHAPKPAPAVIASLQKDENHQAAKSLRERLQAVAQAVRSADGNTKAEQAKEQNSPDVGKGPADTPAQANTSSASGSAPEVYANADEAVSDPVTPAEAQALADQVSLPERADEEERVRMDDAAEDIESIEEPREKSKGDSRRIEDALARVLGTSSAPTEDAESPRQESGHRYYVQVAATPSLEGAQKLLDSVKGAGFSAVVVQGEGKGQEPVYRVRVGPLADREQAVSHVDLIQNKAGMSGFVIRD